MAALLQIASRVEAATRAYISVRDFTDTQKWKEMFLGEMVSTHIHGVLTTLHLK
jgi:hypothetical protein